MKAEEDRNRMVENELEAAVVLAELAHLAANRSLIHGCESLSERVKAESDAGNSCFDPVVSFPKPSINLNEKDQANFCHEDSKKTCIWTTETVKDEHNTELRSNASCPTKYPYSSGRKSRQSLTEAEKEARKIRRVLANRVSARQTICRRQAIYEELTRKAANLARENKNLKRKKKMASKEFNYLKSTNECLKAQMIKIMKVEADEIHGQSSRNSDELNTCSSSTNSSFIMCSQSSFLPFSWTSLIEPTRSTQQHFPLSITNPSSSENMNSGMRNGTRSPLYMLPHPWLFPFGKYDKERHPCSFNLNDKPTESSVAGDRAIMHETRQLPVVCSGKKLCDIAAASEARKRRKQLIKKKGLHWRQLQI